MVLLLGAVMRGAVKLDDQLAVFTDEIRDIAANRRLPAKLEPVEPAIAQPVPEQALCIGHVSAQSAGQRQRAGGGASRHRGRFS